MQTFAQHLTVFKGGRTGTIQQVWRAFAKLFCSYLLTSKVISIHGHLFKSYWYLIGLAMMSILTVLQKVHTDIFGNHLGSVIIRIKVAMLGTLPQQNNYLSHILIFFFHLQMQAIARHIVVNIFLYNKDSQ